MFNTLDLSSIKTTMTAIFDSKVKQLRLVKVNHDGESYSPLALLNSLRRRWRERETDRERERETERERQRERE